MITRFMRDTPLAAIEIEIEMQLIPFIFYGIEAIYCMLFMALGRPLGGWILCAGRQAVFFMGDALLQKTYTVDFLSKKRVKNQGIVP